MVPKRIAVKFFAEPDPGPGLDLAPAIGLFHRFIQGQKVEGLLVDVADYAHVPEGPGVVLIGHDVDYGIDLAGGRTGLLITRKHFGDLALGDALRDTLRKGLLAMGAIEKDGALSLGFSTETFDLQLLDRLAAPNSDEAFESVRDEIAPLLGEIFDGAAPGVSRASADEPRRPLTLSIKPKTGVDAATLLSRLGAG